VEGIRPPVFFEPVSISINHGTYQGLQIMMRLNSAAAVFAVADVGATMRWYKEELGFSGDAVPATEPFVFGIIWRDHVEIMLMRLEGYQKPNLYERRAGGVWDAYLRVSGVKEFYEAVKDRLEIKQPLRRQPYGQWEFEVRDPNGYILVFAEAFLSEGEE